MIYDILTGISSEIRTKLRDWAIWQARAGCYSQAALSSNDSKTLYRDKIWELNQIPDEVAWDMLAASEYVNSIMTTLVRIHKRDHT